MWEVVLLAEVEDWYLRLGESDPISANRIMDASDHLAQSGPSLGRPMVDRIHGGRMHKLKELRPGSSGRSEVRMLFVFDPEREAVILVAGDKSGQWNRWYHENIPLAERRYGDYLIDRKNEEKP